MPTRILSLSGGGIRGIFQAVYLKEVSQRLQTPLRDHFDMIAGTSTGAIIALGVALGIDLARIVELFEAHGSTIFPPRIRQKSKRTISWLGTGPRYNSSVLRNLLRDVFKEGSRQLQMSDCRPPVLIPAVTLDRYQIRIFTHLERCGISDSADGELFAADVALACAAAPVFFSPVRPSGRTLTGDIRREERSYVDGGLWANNPALLAVMEAQRYFGTSFNDMRLISVGNGELPTGVVAVDFDSMRRAKMVESILDMMFATQSELADRSAAQLLDDNEMTGERMLRVNAQLANIIELDDAAEAMRRLKPLAEQTARDSFRKFSRLVGPPE